MNEQLGLSVNEVKFKDGAVTTVDINFGWLDRLRILWHGKACVHVHVKTENVIGEVDSDSFSYVPHIFPRKAGGEEHVPMLEGEEDERG